MLSLVNNLVSLVIIVRFFYITEQAKHMRSQYPATEQIKGPVNTDLNDVELLTCKLNIYHIYTYNKEMWYACH